MLFGCNNLGSRQYRWGVWWKACGFVPTRRVFFSGLDACDFVPTQVVIWARSGGVWFWRVVLACEKSSIGTLWDWCHSKLHSKKISYKDNSKTILPVIAASRLEQIWKADVVLYPENLWHGGFTLWEHEHWSPQVGVSYQEFWYVHKYIFHRFQCREM